MSIKVALDYSAKVDNPGLLLWLWVRTINEVRKCVGIWVDFNSMQVYTGYILPRKFYFLDFTNQYRYIRYSRIEMYHYFQTIVYQYCWRIAFTTLLLTYLRLSLYNCPEDLWLSLIQLTFHNHIIMIKMQR